MEIISQLERQGRVIDLLILYLINILAWGKVVLVFLIIGYAATGYDAFEVQLFAQGFTGFVKTAR